MSLFRVKLQSASVLAVALGLAMPQAVFAQSQPQTPPGTPESSQQDDDQTASPQQQNDTAATAEESAAPLETGTGDSEIVVTGSRIARPEFSFPNPIQSFTAETLEQSGETNITDFLLDTPALVGSSGSGQTSGSNGFFESAGLNLLNLRNLGTQRTLVLVNGRRHVAAYPGTAAVDINSIPLDLIDRVDILTGGTSAIYGADGVSGVVNFVLKRNFEGVRARGQIGVSERGDAGNQFASILAGHNFGDNRGNVAIAYQFNRNERLNDKDRPYTGDPLRRFELLRVAPPTDRPDNPAIFDRVLVNNVRWLDSSPDGAVDVDLDGIPDFTGSGGIYDRGIPLPGTGGRTIGGSGTPTAGYFGDFEPYLKAHNLNLLSSYEVSDAFRLFAEGKFSLTRAFTISQPTFDFFTYLAPDNAYLLQRFGDETAPDGAFVSRDNLDFGIRGDRAKRKTWRGVLGADGKLGDNLRYELSYVYGRAVNATTSENDRYGDRYYAALDAVINPANGQITCRINLPGETIIDPNNFGQAPTTFRPGECRPLTILGQANQSGLDFVLADHTSRSRLQQHVVNGYISGDLGNLFTLPGGAIGYAVGAEYRKEISDQVPSLQLQNGEILDSSEIEPSKGSFSVKEVFAELNIPLLKDLPFAHSLGVGGAIRLSDYTTIGKATTWKVDSSWAPVRDITFRGTLSQAVRAPNISELFDPRSGTFAFITDPCDIANRTSGSSTRAANCVALLTSLGLTPAQIANFSPTSDPEASVSQPGITGGNPDLNEETAKTWTLGVVLRPRFIPGLTISADYYNIRLKQAISTPAVTELFELCVDQPTLDNPFCANTSRDPVTGFPNGFTLIPQNVARYTTEGMDFQLNYRFRLSPNSGTFNARVVGGWLRDLTFIGTPGADPDQDAGEAFSPKVIGVFDLTWTKGPLTLNYGLAFQSKTRRFTKEQITANPDLSDPKFFFYSRRWEHDVQAAYEVQKDRFSVYAGVNNLTDEQPDVASGGAYPYSPRGRYYYVGVRTGLNKIF